MKIKGAIFDMDGTLVDSLFIWDVLWSELGKKYGKGEGFVPTAEDQKAVRTMLLAEVGQLLHNNYDMGESGADVLNTMDEIMIDFYSNTVELKDGVEEFLEYLKSQGVKMCLASATAQNLLKHAIEHCRLDRYMSKIISCADIGKGKEEPDVFEAALEFLGTDKDETYVFEDSFVAVKTAHDNGFKVVGIFDKYGYRQDIIRENSDYYIAEGETLKKLIEK